MATNQNQKRNQVQYPMGRGVSGYNNRNNRTDYDDPVASTEQAALMVAMVLLMGVVLVLVVACVALILDLKTEKDINRILQKKIVGRMIQCP